MEPMSLVEVFAHAWDRASIQTLLQAVVVLVLGALLASLARFGCNSVLCRIWPSAAPATRLLVGRLLRYGILLLSLMTALEIVGIKLTTLFTLGTVLFVGIGLALQKIGQSLVAGVLLLAEREIEPGDIVLYEGELCRVLDISLRTSILETKRDDTIVVPNYLLATNAVRNLTHRNPRYWIEADVSVGYETDVATARRALLEAAEGLEGREGSQAPQVLLRELGASGVVMRIRCAVVDPWESPTYRDALLERAWTALRRADVRIPYAQLDIHIDHAGTGASALSAR
jgi:small-conductance mechanosensitive channel